MVKKVAPALFPVLGRKRLASHYEVWGLWQVFVDAVDQVEEVPSATGQMCLPKIYVEVLTPTILERDCIWRQTL